MEIGAWFVDETRAEVGANAIDIFHECDRVAENAVVDSLDDVATLVAIVLEAGGKGIVDESIAEGAALGEGSFDAKGAADVFEAHGVEGFSLKCSVSRIPKKSLPRRR